MSLSASKMFRVDRPKLPQLFLRHLALSVLRNCLYISATPATALSRAHHSSTIALTSFTFAPFFANTGILLLLLMVFLILLWVILLGLVDHLAVYFPDLVERSHHIAHYMLLRPNKHRR
jgi:hypothetical protein